MKRWQAMTDKTRAVLLGSGIAAILGAALYFGVGSQPLVTLPSIVVDYFCRQTMSTQPQLVVYSGQQAMSPFQWGIAAVDVVAGTGYAQNGIGKNDPAVFCASPMYVQGDCWQSITKIAATPDNPKWVVFTGAPPQCGVQGLQVLKWNAGIKRFQWHGFISAPIERSGPFMETPKLDGDFAYAIEPNSGGAGVWLKFDLNAKTVVAGNLPEPVTPPVQSSIGGYTYTVAPILPDPPSPHRFTWTRHGGPVETPTVPVPTSVPTSTASPIPAVTCLPTKVITVQVTRLVTAIPTKTKTPCIGCPLPTFTQTPHIGPAPTKTHTPHIGPAPTKKS